MTLWLMVRAPFAAYRWLQAGAYHSTSPVMPPSAAYGLVLNLAHVDARLPRAMFEARATPYVDDAPQLRIAVGSCSEPGLETTYQHAHRYLVNKGNLREGAEERAHGTKNTITPTRREILTDLACVLGVQGEWDLLSRVVRGLRGELDEDRFGLPFAGDSNFTFSSIDVLDEAPPARWYARAGAPRMDRGDACRLTIDVDRADNTRTRAAIYAPTEVLAAPPEDAWTWCPRAA